MLGIFFCEVCNYHLLGSGFRRNDERLVYFFTSSECSEGSKILSNSPTKIVSPFNVYAFCVT
jgi:hypothetical protein